MLANASVVVSAVLMGPSSRPCEAFESGNSLVSDPSPGSAEPPSTARVETQPGSCFSSNMAAQPSQAGTFTSLPREQLLGRQREREVLERFLEAARGGDGGVLVVYREPGGGKTALLEYAVEAGRQFRVLRTAGVEGEMELPYAALQQLCSPILDLMERLPDPQGDALAVAFGLTRGKAPNPFLVGLAVLGLLS